MAKIDKVIGILEEWQSGANKPNKSGFSVGGGDDYSLGNIRSTLNGGQPLSPSPALQNMSIDELEELRRAYERTTSNYDVDFRGITPDGVRPGIRKRHGSPITQHTNEVMKGNRAEFTGVEQPDYNFRGFRTDNPNVSQPTDAEILEALSNPALKKVY